MQSFDDDDVPGATYDGYTLLEEGEDNAWDKILRALAQHPNMDARKLAVLTGLKRSGSTTRNTLARLRGEGLVEKGELTLTEAGRVATANLRPLPTGSKLRKLWLKKLGDSAPGKILALLIRHYPGRLGAEIVAGETNLVLGGSTMRNAMAKLRGLDLVEKKGYRASDELFDGDVRASA